MSVNKSVISLFAVLSLGGCQLVGRPTEATHAPLAVGGPAPSFTLSDLKGERVALAALFRSGITHIMRNGRLIHEPRQAKHVLLVLGHMTCRYTMAQVQEAGRLAQNTCGRDLAILVVLEGPRDAIPEWAREKGAAIRVLIDPGGQVLRRYRVRKTPDICLVRTDGVMVYRSGGGFLAAEQLGPLVETLLAGKGFGGVALPKPGAG